MKRLLSLLLALMLAFPAIAAAQTDTAPPVKQETVYVDTDASGLPTRILVSAYLSNLEKEKTLPDVSNLADIVALGNQSFSQDGEQIVWEADEEGVYYQGESEQPLPVSLRVEYRLDGELLSPDELAGRSGHLRIEVSYENHVSKEYAILDETSVIYTPFAVLTMFTLDNDICSNIRVTDARTLQQDGTETIIGISFPGLAASLDAGPDILSLPDTFSVEADVEDFRMDAFTTLVSANLLTEEDLKEPARLQELLGDLDELSEASDELVDGTKELSDGVGDFGDGVDELTDAHKELRSALKKLAEGMGDLSDGANSLRKGADQAKEGVDTIAGSITALADGIREMRDNTKKLQKAAKSIADAVDGASGGSSVDLSDVKKLVKSNKKLIESLQGAGDESPAVEALAGTNSALDSLVKAIEKNASAGSDLSALADAANALADGLSQLVDAQKEMANGADALAEGTKEASSGLKSLSSGAKSLKGGIDSAADGAKELKKGADKLVASGGEFKDGYQELKDGVDELADGMKEFDEDGIKELVAEANDAADGLRQRRAALIELSEAYVTFSGLPEGRDGSVTFLYQSAAIEKSRSVNRETIDAIASEEPAPEEPNLWERFTGWLSWLFGGE